MSRGGLYSTCAEKWAGQLESQKILSDHKNFITKIYFNANLERFTKFSNHETLELYVVPKITCYVQKTILAESAIILL